MMMTFTATSDEKRDHSGSILDPLLREVRHTVLPNGLTVLITPDSGTGVVAINTWVKAGYFHEPDEVAGMAHLFEHMFFKGSKKFPGPSRISRELSRVGGQTNAGTIYDRTSYYFVLPSEGFERGLEIQADAIMNPLFDPEELDKESEVVIEESNRKLDNPPAVAMERMFATAFEKHRIRRWRIGSNEVLRAIDRDDLMAFFHTLYVPENIVLSIAGDIDPDEALELVKETFGTIPKGESRREHGPAEPEQEEFRFGRSKADIQQGYTSMGWHTVPVGHDDELALEILATILGSGRSSRFFRNVVGPEAASTASAFNWSMDELGVFVVSASFDEENREEVESRLIREIERLKEFGPTEYELTMARTKEESSSIMQLQSALGKAQSLAWAEAYGGYQILGQRLEQLPEIDQEKIRDVARRYLTLDRLTLYHYQPEDAEAGTRKSVLTHLSGALESGEPRPEEDYPTPAADRSFARAEAAEDPVETRLENGASLVVMERPGAPVVSAGIFFRGGRLGENSSNAGITRLMQRVMKRGTTSRSAEEINREIEFFGTQIGTESDSDYFGFGLTIMSKYADAGLDLLSDVVLNPTFPEQGLDEERHLQSAAIQRSFDSSIQRPFQLLYENFYGNHPYSLPSDGYISSLKTIDRDDLQNWWSGWVRSDEALIIIVGDISAEDAEAAAETYFGRLKPRGEDVELPEIPEWTPPENTIITVEQRDRKQSAIALAWPAVAMDHPDWPYLRLLQNVTSGLAGTFFEELRSRRSLAYTVFAGESARAGAGAFVGYLASEASKEPEAREALIEEFRRLDDGGITAEDVERARAYLAGSTRISLQTHSAHVNRLAESWMYELGLDFTERLLEKVEEITLDEMKAIAGRYFEEDNWAMAVVSGR